MADIKNITIDGTTYDLKDAKAREDVSDLKEDFDDYGVLFQTGSVNQWDESWTNGFYRIADGAISNSANYVRSRRLIPVAPNTSYFFKTALTENYLVYYDRNKTFISGVSASHSFTFTTPNNCYYIGISFSGTSYSNNVSVNYPSTIMDYTAFDKLAERFIVEKSKTALNMGTDAIVVSPSNYSTLGITDATALAPNRTYAFISTITSSMVANLPVYGKYCSVVKISPTNANAYSLYLAITFDDNNIGDMYFAHGYSTSIRGWSKVAKAPTPQNFSILSDSYGTFLGWNPTGNEEYYPTYSSTVNDVAKTWWHILANALGWSLLCNDSYSGATVSTHVRPGHDVSVAFVNRMKVSMGQNKNIAPKPNVIFIMGGQNDSNTGVEVGEVKYSGWTNDDLYKFAPAFCYMLYYLKTWNPGARIINITNTGLSSAIQQAMASACTHYEIENIILSDIDKDNGHPTTTGMIAIANQIVNAIK